MITHVEGEKGGREEEEEENKLLHNLNSTTWYFLDNWLLPGWPGWSAQQSDCETNMFTNILGENLMQSKASQKKCTQKDVNVRKNG
jgi:hypothetical protein